MSNDLTDSLTESLNLIVGNCKREKVEALQSAYEEHRQLVLESVERQFSRTKEQYMCFATPTYGDRYTLQTSQLWLSWSHKPFTSSQECDITFPMAEDPPKDLRQAGISQLIELSDRLASLEKEMDERIANRIQDAKKFLQERG